MPLLHTKQRHFSFWLSKKTLENLLALHEFGQYPKQRKAILSTNQLTNRVHAKLRHANIKRCYPQICSRQRPNGAATAHIAAHHKALVRQAKLITDMPVNGCGSAVGCVTLIMIHLD